MGFGVYRQNLCRTNGIGPEIYQECAKTTTYAYEGEIYIIKLYCIKVRIGKPPPPKTDFLPEKFQYL